MSSLLSVVCDIEIVGKKVVGAIFSLPTFIERHDQVLERLQVCDIVARLRRRLRPLIRSVELGDVDGECAIHVVVVVPHRTDDCEHGEDADNSEKDRRLPLRPGLAA